MIKIKDFEGILNANAVPEVLQAAVGQFGAGLEGKSKSFVADLLELQLPQNITQAYFQEGLSVLNSTLTKKKADVSQVPAGYLVYTGLLNREVVIGIDTATQGKKSVDLYTKSEAILRKLQSLGAFDEDDKFEKQMEAIFKEGGKVLKGFEAMGLAMGRIDIAKVLGDSVSLKLTPPKSFRQDQGDTFKLYPYSTFVAVAQELAKYSNNLNKVADVKKKRYLTIYQSTLDGAVKTRKVAFNPNAVKEVYIKCPTTLQEVDEIKLLIENKIAKSKCGWDCLKLALKGYNLESSLYGVGYTVIRLQDITGVQICKLSDMDTSQYLVDYDDLRNLFRTKVNSWKLADFGDFRVVDTSTCSNIPDRKAMLTQWADKVEDRTLYKLMESNAGLFGDITDGLANKYRLKPKAEKGMQVVQLPDDPDERVKKVKDFLKKGICKIEAISSSTGSTRNYICSTNEDILRMKLGANYALKFESTRQKLDRIAKEINEGKITDYDKFVERIYGTADLSAIVPVATLNSSSTPAEMIAALEEGKGTIKERAPISNPYIVNFKRTNAETVEDFYGAVDVRNIETFEFGAL